VLTAVAFFAIGVIRGRIVDRRPLAAGVETLLIGGSAALLAFAVGRLLHGLAD
jgi:VIT1/CCC1 family predicted Fe2+/Mn2+ transporter